MIRFVLILALGVAVPFAARGQEETTLTVVVMDPLAAPLSCPCVQGYAQRDYVKLGQFLEKQLGKPVKVYFSESLSAALVKKTEGKADLIIGKESVVRTECKTNSLSVAAVAALTGKDGKTTQTGLWVVASSDPALTVADLKNYRLIFGPVDSDEKHAAALSLLNDFEVKAPKSPETCTSCSDGACKILDVFKAGGKAATIISSYAQPLLEGCGTIKKGDLRVIGETDPVPFITAFVNDRLKSSDSSAIQKALLRVGDVPDLCLALETKYGFTSIDIKKK